VRNLAFGAAVGAGIGLVQVVSSPSTLSAAAIAGVVLGGALGGAVVFVLASALWRMIVR
jgi:hypothetical protein